MGAGSARGDRRRVARWVAAATLIAAACGGQSQRTGESAEPGTGGVGGVGGIGGVGVSGGGSAGRPSGCPSTPPRAAVFADSCPSGLPAEGCRYTLECQSGPQEFVYRCQNESPEVFVPAWSLEPVPCAEPYDSCFGGDGQIRCGEGGSSYMLQGYGGDPPPDCPNRRPVEASECPVGFANSTPGPCGYRCADGSGWTLAACTHGSTPPRWLLDDGCPGSCGVFERALLNYVAAHSECNTDTDCRYFISTCTVSRQICNGAIPVGPRAIQDELLSLDAALSECAASSPGEWECGGCDLLPTVARCLDGTCVMP
jgi:hypothetical protein